MLAEYLSLAIEIICLIIVGCYTLRLYQATTIKLSVEGDYEKLFSLTEKQRIEQLLTLNKRLEEESQAFGGIVIGMSGIFLTQIVDLFFF